jgi:hypothetical protein
MKIATLTAALALTTGAAHAHDAGVCYLSELLRHDPGTAKEICFAEHERALGRVMDKIRGNGWLIYKPDGTLLAAIRPYAEDDAERCLKGDVSTADQCLERLGWRFVEKRAAAGK